MKQNVGMRIDGFDSVACERYSRGTVSTNLFISRLSPQFAPTRGGLFGLAARIVIVTAFMALGGCGPSYPSCDEDGDCHENEFCVNDQCQLCRDNADCQAGEQCNAGRCDPIEGYCTGNSACPNGQECENNQCVAVSSEGLSLPTNDGPVTNTGCQIEPIYFSYNGEQIDSSSRDILAANVRCMNERNIGRLHATGYTDARGTEEYNLALGDRRARSVIQYMISLGANQSSLSASSMGEEMSQGDSEASWRLDRKVVFVER